ncbi:MAG: twin-arginine translocation signal domain-containing protein, partial [Burkholderiales bacterium]
MRGRRAARAATTECTVNSLQFATSRSHRLKTRRQFLAHATAGLLGAAAATLVNAQTTTQTPSAGHTEPTPGAPPAFGTSPP